MHSPLRYTAYFVTIAMLGWFSTAFASPIEGEFFGYRLGTRYPVTDDIKGSLTPLGTVELVAEKPEKPADFQRVEMVATAKTLTIVNIYGIAEFSDEKHARAFAEQYADLLGTAHGGECRSKGAVGFYLLRLLCGEQYELTVSLLRSDKTGEKHTVHVGLKFDSASKAGKQITAKIHQEIEQLEAEGKTYRFEKAKKEQKLRGLQ